MGYNLSMFKRKIYAHFSFIEETVLTFVLLMLCVAALLIFFYLQKRFGNTNV